MFSIKKTWTPAVIAIVVVLDQITKYLADRFIVPSDPVTLLPFLSLVNVQNTGAAFGLFKTLGNTFFIGISIVAIAFMVFLILKGKENYLGLSLILSGAAGNFIDRIFLGHVRDFADFHIGNYHWPAFNVADAALTIGITILILTSFFQTEKNVR